MYTVCVRVCVAQIAELNRAIAVGRKKVKERRAVEEQLVQRQIEVGKALPSLLPPSSPFLTSPSAIRCCISTISPSSLLKLLEVHEVLCALEKKVETPHNSRIRPLSGADVSHTQFQQKIEDVSALECKLLV